MIDRAPPEEDKRNGSRRIKALLGQRRNSMVLVLVGMVVLSAIISPTFRSVTNILNILNQNAILGIMAVGMSFVLVTGAFDLSVGSTVALTGVVSTYLFKNFGFVPGFVGGVSVGLLIGFVNGVLIAKAKINPFVVTLGMMSIGRGIVFIITSGFPVMGVPSGYGVIGMGKIGVLPIAASIWMVLAVLMYLIMKTTRFGQYVYAIGGSENASWLSGINTDRIKISAFMLSGGFASLAGLIMVFRVLIATADAASGYELTAIASCVVGGISLDGGRGSVMNSVVGVLILGLVFNMLQLSGVSSFWQDAFTGMIIIGAVGIDSLSKSKRD